jgi:Leu/Phe-tRNA-protein transferase
LLLQKKEADKLLLEANSIILPKPKPKPKPMPKPKLQWAGDYPCLRPQDDIAALMPEIVKKLEGDFCVSTSFDPGFIQRLVYFGLMPMSTQHSPNTYILLPKLHQHRCVIFLAPNSSLHVPHKAVKRAKKFSLVTNKNFDLVVAKCHEQHGSSCWLYPPLVAAFKALFIPSSLANAAKKSKSSADIPAPDPGRARIHTFELYFESQLVAGEIGYSFGACYTSLSGFHTMDSSGTIQCVATGAYLQRQGYQLWDLGMQMAYKMELGAQLLERSRFVETLVRVRDVPNCLIDLREPTNAWEIIVGPEKAASTKEDMNITQSNPTEKQEKYKKSREKKKKEKQQQQQQAPETPIVAEPGKELA